MDEPGRELSRAGRPAPGRARERADGAGPVCASSRVGRDFPILPKPETGEGELGRL